MMELWRWTMSILVAYRQQARHHTGDRRANRCDVGVKRIGGMSALDPGKLSVAERSLRRLPAVRAALPEGDIRDWAEIEEWARAIA
jgi:hypothetical protein